MASDKLEDLIYAYNNESDKKRKQVLYLNLVSESLKLVNKIVSSIYPLPSSLSREDLTQVGAIGLLKSIPNYKIKDKGSFKTYASKFIKGQILHYLRDKADIVKLPRETTENISAVKNYIGSFGSDVNLNPQDIAKALNMPTNRVQDILNINIIKNIVSLDQKIYSSDGIETLADRIPSEDNQEFEFKFDNKKVIEFALNQLPQAEKKAIYSFYIEGNTKKSIAQELKVSQTQVARLIKRALNKMYVIIKNDMNYKEGK